MIIKHKTMSVTSVKIPLANVPSLHWQHSIQQRRIICEMCVSSKTLPDREYPQAFCHWDIKVNDYYMPGVTVHV